MFNKALGALEVNQVMIEWQYEGADLERVES
jgi:hypothetical protein